jgi:hypothetical protein
MEDDINLFVIGRGPQYIFKWKTTSVSYQLTLTYLALLLLSLAQFSPSLYHVFINNSNFVYLPHKHGTNLSWKSAIDVIYVQH